MEIPKPKSIIVWGILVLEENNAAAKTIAKNIGIIYSRVRVFPPPPPLKTVTVLLVEEEEGIAAVSNRYYYCSYCFGDQCNCYSDSIIIAYSIVQYDFENLILRFKSHHHSHRVLAISEW